MTTPLFDYSIAAELRRLADAAERIADAAERRAAAAERQAAAAAPADFDSAQYADAFDAKMGNPLAALGRLTPVAELIRNAPIGIALNDAQPGEQLRVKLTCAAPAAPAADPVKPAKRRWTHWSKVDPRSRELAKLGTDAGKQMKAAKTPETRAAKKADKNAYKTEAKARQKRLQQWLDAGKGIIDGDALCYFDAAGTKIKWVPSPTPNFFLPY
jgi:hypothetical protein